MNRRNLLRVLGAAGMMGPLWLNSGCSQKPTRQRPPKEAKVLFLGFDGVEPSLFEQWMSEGALPNLQSLSQSGSYTYLGSTNPPQSPVAWSSFATGMHPGGHGIFDFIKRDPLTHLPDFALNAIEFPKPCLGLLPGGQLRARNLRRGDPFWLTAAQQGVRVCALQIPYTFPPVTLPGGRCLTGLGTPDLRGTNSTFYYYGSDRTESGETAVSGGRLFPLKINNDRAQSIIPGPPLGSDDNRYLSIPVQFERIDQGVRITVSDQQCDVPDGAWSPWTTFKFSAAGLWSIIGIGRFLVLESHPHIRVYLTPIGTHPAHQFVPTSSPEQFAADVYHQLGDFSTVGWIHDTSAVDAGILPDDNFLNQILETMDFRERVLMSQMDTRDWDLLMAVFTATDRGAHMFYRYLDPQHPRHNPADVERLGQPIKTIYQRMDDIVGRVLERIDSDTRLIVMSDHGFHNFRRGFHLNTWLAKQGLIAFKGVPSGTLPDPVPEDSFYPNVDWRKTKTYAFGTGALYLNLKGRERMGTVSAQESQNLCAQIRNQLKDCTDPENGARVFREIYFGDDIFQGAAKANAPDMQLGYADGYRGSAKTLLGGFGAELLEDNQDAWSGDHAASDVAETNGILLTNWKLTGGSPAITDMAPTILDMFGIAPPPEMVGNNIL